MAEKKRDLMPVVAIGVGGAAVAAGIYFFGRKPKGVDPGDVLMAKFTFDYYGQGGTYILQVSLGKILIGDWFDHVEGLTWYLEITLPIAEEPPQSWEFLVACPLPEAVEPSTYDGEALIRTPDMDKLDYLVKATTHGAIKVREE